MVIQGIDWGIIVLYFLISISIGIIMSKRAGKSMDDFFLTGRNLPWWIAGTSMVATTFAADTPLAITELVAQNGIAGNWFWWNMILGSMLTVFFFARLWRRAGILTDCEFVAIRYSGKPAAFLRGFRAVYLGLFMNVIVIAWVNLAMVKILTVTFPDLTFFGIKQLSFLGFVFSAHLLTVGCLMLFVAVYSALSGLWGVSITDSFQFTMAMAGCIVLAIYAVNSPQIGGIAGLKEKLPEWVFKFNPEFGGTDTGQSASSVGLLKMSGMALIVYLCVQWWAIWYPGAEPGGGGYVAQRMMSAKNEKHSLLAVLWFNIAHYGLRPWPWIIVALCSMVLYPQLPDADKGAGFVMIIRDLLPPGLVGLLLAAFLAAYMSTIASQCVLGTSYIVNDLYRPFIKPGASEKYYVRVARITTFLMMAFSLVVTSKMGRISDAWKFVMECSCGLGVVLILRWFWWRINAWSEMAAMVAPFIVYPIIKLKLGIVFPNSLLIFVAWSLLVWVSATFLTRPTDESTLLAFYRRVHPGGVLWKPIAEKAPDVIGDSGYLKLFVDWLAGCVLVMFGVFGVGKIIFGQLGLGLVFLVIAFLAAAVIYRHLSQTGWEKVGD
ncbi:MAG TPA: sodium:solute symporter family protein [Sedimentisphaerales bacterium]|nr:sodium:solute symporter family protein [Sedimentisphaerales bacterium]